MSTKQAAIVSLSDVEIAALEAAVDAKVAKTRIKTGVHTVDFTVRIQGTVKKSENQKDVPVPAKADPWGLLALALSKLNGVTVDALVREHKAFDEAQLKKVKDEADAAIGKIVAATKTDKSGATRVQVVVTVLGERG